MHLSVTAFHLRSLSASPLFFFYVLRVVFQLKKTKGLIRHQTFPLSKNVHCTLTAWHAQSDMLHFRNSGAHRSAMRHAAKMGEGVVYSWDATAWPSPAQAIKLLRKKHPQAQYLYPHATEAKALPS